MNITSHAWSKQQQALFASPKRTNSPLLRNIVYLFPFGSILDLYTHRLVSVHWLRDNGSAFSPSMPAFLSLITLSARFAWPFPSVSRPSLTPPCRRCNRASRFRAPLPLCSWYSWPISCVPAPSWRWAFSPRRSWRACQCLSLRRCDEKTLKRRQGDNTHTYCDAEKVGGCMCINC
jgi:hypothetical protein